MSQTTLGDTMHDVEEKMKQHSYSIRHVIKSSIKFLLLKRRVSALEKQVKILAQYVQSVYGTQSLEKNHTASGVDSHTESETPSSESGVN